MFAPLSIGAFALLLVACAPKQEQPAPSATPQASTTTPPATAAGTQPEEKCTNEPRTDENDQRPRCGGMGAPQVASHAYRITLDNGESFTACDITQPFNGKIGRDMISMDFTPSSASGGTVKWHFAGAGGTVDMAYDYRLSGPEERMTGTFQASSAVCGKASGLTACAAAKQQSFTSTWTRIPACTDSPK
ncbi:MAG: hypothetical protein IT472_03785 [Thermomonas sp.]|uniref:hypothetical protein n=1 Tax=Thermomonas sp. TaxID=1971895 RepID=UPI00260273C0|nr:hypothetical protein [Thermomonas sp.]MCC7096286.1 hypothetical protein [Thermomonas sp.]